MKWKTTVVLLLATVGIGAFISLYEIKQPSVEERQRISLELLDIAPESVTQIEIQGSTAAVSLSRDGARWWLGPQRIRANEELIGQLLSTTAPLMAQRLLTETPDKPLDLAAFGLNPAKAQLTLTAEGKTTTLLVGETTPVHNNRYAKRADQPQVAIIGPILFETINQPPEAFRDPLLLRFDTWLADAVTITTQNRILALTRDGTDWQLTQPVNDRADRAAVMNFLSTVGGLQVARVVEETPQKDQPSAWGFDAPHAEITLTLRGDSPSFPTVSFGKPLPDDESLRYAKRSDEQALYAVAAASVDALLQDPNSLRAKACVEFFTSEVTKVEVKRGETGWTIERKDDTWRSVSDTKLGTEAVPALVSDTGLDASRVEAFLNTLADLRLVDFVEEQPQDPARYGLAPPEGTITVWTSDPEKPQRLLVGSTIEASTNRYGRIDGREPVVSLPEAVTALLDTPLEHLRQPPESASPENITHP
ncbi:MAG: DUF4340 domain-containing protein [Candidatus Omnitrophica bacterium]|nr:DUF4340 domain-containing protein [Candidatus Omnitrophota bacterium]